MADPSDSNTTTGTSKYKPSSRSRMNLNRSADEHRWTKDKCSCASEIQEPCIHTYFWPLNAFIVHFSKCKRFLMQGAAVIGKVIGD